MKKITLFLLLLSFSFSFSQVLTEDFEAGLSLPAGWTNNDIQGGGDIWTFSDSADAIGYTPPNGYMYDLAGAAGNYAIFNSDGWGDNSIAENAALESPVFSCAGLTQVTLNFNHFFTEGYGGAAFVEVFNGISWVQVATYSTLDFGLISLDVTSDLAGVANAQVRFRWTGDYAWAWAVDNVSVFECTVSAPNAVTSTNSPLDGATDVPITILSTSKSVGPMEWVPNALGDPADSYSISLGITTSGDDIGTIPNFTNGGDIFYASFAPSTLYYWRVDAVNCAGITQGPVWSFTTAACTDSAPNPVITPGPSDGAVDVALDNSDTNFPDRVYFSWSDGLGDPGDAFTLNFGVQNPPTDLAATNFTNGDFLFNLSENTTYWWSVDAVNCGGTSTPVVWSFTTGMALEVSDNEINLFSVYPNPVKNIARIDTELSIDSINIVNHLGQNVLSLDSNRIINNQIDLSSLSTGLYFMNIYSGDKSELIKIVKE